MARKLLVLILKNSLTISSRIRKGSGEIKSERQRNRRTIKGYKLVHFQSLLIIKKINNNINNIAGKHEVTELQKTAIFGTAHILRKVLM